MLCFDELPHLGSSYHVGNIEASYDSRSSNGFIGFDMTCTSCHVLLEGSRIFPPVSANRKTNFLKIVPTRSKKGLIIFLLPQN